MVPVFHIFADILHSPVGSLIGSVQVTYVLVVNNFHLVGL